MKKGNNIKKSLKELLAQHPEPKRNDWSNGRPNAPAERQGPRIGPDGFPEYDPKAFESGDDDDEGTSGAGGAFAVLAGLGGASEADEWETVTSKSRRKAGSNAAAAQPAAPASTSAHRASGASHVASTSAAGSRPLPSNGGPPGYRPGVGALGVGPARAPYTLSAAAAVPPPRAPRQPTHGPDGKPLSDSYYQTFQRVYRNAHGAVCLRFHKTDVVVVRPNGDVVLTSGGYKTRTTFCSVAEGLEPLGLELRSTGGDGRGDWFVVLPDGSELEWADGMTVPAAGPEDRTRGDQLFAAYYGTAAAAAAAAGAAAAGAAAAGGRAPPRSPAGPQAGLRAPQPVALSRPPAQAMAAPPALAPGPSAWSYRNAAGPAAAPAPAPYAPHARPAAPAAYATAAAPLEAPEGPKPAAPDELAALLEEALALQDAGIGDGPGSLDDDDACVVCMAATKCCIFIPCGHLVLCEGCAADVMARSGECPMCRERVVSHVTIDP